jgi:hypothetical protein
VADLLEVYDFVRVHAPALRMRHMSMVQLLAALRVESGALVSEFRALPPGVGSTRAPDAYFVPRFLLSLLRVLFVRDVQTGGPVGQEVALAPAYTAAEALWQDLQLAWGEVLNPLTLPEILRRYLSAQEKALRDTAAFTAALTDPYGFSPLGESFMGGEEVLMAATEAMGEGSLERLDSEQVLALMRLLVEGLQDSPLIQQYIHSRLEVSGREGCWLILRRHTRCSILHVPVTALTSPPPHHTLTERPFFSVCSHPSCVCVHDPPHHCRSTTAWPTRARTRTRRSGARSASSRRCRRPRGPSRCRPTRPRRWRRCTRRPR